MGFLQKYFEASAKRQKDVFRALSVHPERSCVFSIKCYVIAVQMFFTWYILNLQRTWHAHGQIASPHVIFCFLLSCLWHFSFILTVQGAPSPRDSYVYLLICPVGRASFCWCQSAADSSCHQHYQMLVVIEGWCSNCTDIEAWWSYNIVHKISL